MKSLKKKELDEIKTEKPGWYYSIVNLPASSEYMADKFLDSKTPVTMIRAENIMSIISENEQAKWIDCCKSFGTMPNHKYVVAKNADHHVWQKNPQIVIEEVGNLYEKVGKKGDAVLLSLNVPHL